MDRQGRVYNSFIGRGEQVVATKEVRLVPITLLKHGWLGRGILLLL